LRGPEGLQKTTIVRTLEVLAANDVRDSRYADWADSIK